MLRLFCLYATENTGASRLAAGQTETAKKAPADKSKAVCHVGWL